MLLFMARLAPAVVLVLVVLCAAGRPPKPARARRASSTPMRRSASRQRAPHRRARPAQAAPGRRPRRSREQGAGEGTDEDRGLSARRGGEARARSWASLWGATGPRSYDCSGLIQAAYGSIGRRIPRTTFGQLARLRTPGRIERGDLVFGIPGHVAMYIGHGRVIHAPAPGRRVQIAAAGWHGPRLALIANLSDATGIEHNGGNFRSNSATLTAPPLGAQPGVASGSSRALAADELRQPADAGR
jgi:NlpC/P60 family